MATVALSTGSLDAGAPDLPSLHLGLIHHLSTSNLDAGAPDLASPKMVMLYEAWPFRPLVGASDTLETLTEVLPSYTEEQRIALRPAPRQNPRYTVKLDPAAFSRAKDFAKRRAATQVCIPIWWEGIRLDGAVISTDTEISIDTTAGDWREGGRLIVYQDEDNYALALITAVAADSVTLLAPIGANFSAPTVAPVRVARPIEGFNINRSGGKLTIEVSARFQVEDNVKLDGDAGYPQYLSLDVLTEPTARVSDISETIIQAAEYEDNGFGKVALERQRDYVDFGQSIAFLEEGAAAVWRRRVWVHARTGKQKAFWLPSFNSDLKLMAPISAADTVVTVKRAGLLAGYVGRHVMIELKDGTRYFRQIVNAALSGSNDQLTLNASLGAGVAVSQILWFSYLSKVRFDSDAVTFNFVASGRGPLVATLSVPVTEVPA
ncbi:hypothetical protein EOA37_09720 [Mesorhizobium sp. M2A.F.Ca.ET.015.02.1.1]|uniref:hypothetical protein n=1 Tax=Mesorhizobium sp. M2A.F.Ca.ET.015.02.1.1 TaxID=2496758 RepID=UPI000FCC3A0D|nr:hypothetical protein [Mesorhizobium sp. M2A.F.Ca.ET.015.02.1.1]RUW41529.1 hypothetical protein EOA37_09720 [Mesorhizobium sp. M2A.F.Ca.ET.015.02.1.1]